MIRVRDIMTRDVVAFAPETPLVEAIETLAERHISGAPVMRGDAIVGILTSSDILEFVAANPTALAEFGDEANLPDTRWSALSGHLVSEAMSGGPPSTIPPDAPVQAAAAMMREAGIHRVFVVDREEVVGVVTSLDVTRALADRRVGNRTYVFPNQ
ncbi:MAG: CBS domain-containing protein [Gemmatimonadetes bacterium]|nr:CBS domain-containing protein [Gemmatimonadota bacterium]